MARRLITITIIAALFIVTPLGAIDLKKIKWLEQQSLLQAARKAADAGDFDQAEGYLAQARQKTSDSKGTDAAQAYIAKKHRAEQASRRTASRSSSTSGSSGSCASQATVTFNWEGSVDNDPRISVSGSGQASVDVRQDYAIISAYGGCVAGSYQFTYDIIKYGGGITGGASSGRKSW